MPESLGAQTAIPHGAHVMGGLRMGSDPRSSVTDGNGVVHGTDNVLVADGSVFPTSGGHNPTLTIMATALRNARRLVHADTHPKAGTTAPTLPATGGAPVGAFVATAALLAGLTARRGASEEHR